MLLVEAQLPLCLSDGLLLVVIQRQHSSMVSMRLFLLVYNLLVKVGNAAAGYNTGGNSESINSVAGDGSNGGSGGVGGIMFTSGMGASASLRLTCVSTSSSPVSAVLDGVRWVGTGQVVVAQDIDVST